MLIVLMGKKNDPIACQFHSLDFHKKKGRKKGEIQLMAVHMQKLSDRSK